MSCDLLIIGGDGDLALRKLYPALYSLWRSECLSGDTRIIAVARRDLSHQEFLEQVRAWFAGGKSAGQFVEALWDEFARGLQYCRQDATCADGLARLRVPAHHAVVDAQHFVQHFRVDRLLVERATDVRLRQTRRQDIVIAGQAFAHVEDPRHRDAAFTHHGFVVFRHFGDELMRLGGFV